MSELQGNRMAGVWGCAAAHVGTQKSRLLRIFPSHHPHRKRGMTQSTGQPCGRAWLGPSCNQEHSSVPWSRCP